jgi:hypothetical protein
VNTGSYWVELPFKPKFIGRYIDAQENPKSLTTREVDFLNRKNTPIISISEEGYPTTDAYFMQPKDYWVPRFKLQAERMRGLGQPLTTPIYAAVDYDVQNVEILQTWIETFIEVINDAGYAAGFYGSGYCLEYCMSLNPHVRTWKSCSSGWRGFGNNVKPNIIQHPTAHDKYDLDVTFNLKLAGAWLPASSKPKYDVLGKEKLIH